MKTFDKQSGICVIVWPRQMLIGRQHHDTAHYFYLFSSRLRRVERITNKLHSLSPHYKLWGEKGGARGEYEGGGRKQNQVILLHITEVWAGKYSNRANANEYQLRPNLFSLQTRTICDCVLVIISYRSFLFSFAGCLLLTKNVDGPKLY